MRMVKYEEYVTGNRCKRFRSSYYEQKYEFIKPRSYTYIHLVEMFIRYMDNDIFINWDKEDEKNWV